MEIKTRTQINDEINVLIIRTRDAWSYHIQDGDTHCRSTNVDEVIEYIQNHSQVGDAFIETLILAMDDGLLNSVTFAKICF